MDVRETILRELERGQGVERAYRRAAEVATASLEASMGRGVPGSAALRDAGLPEDGRLAARLGGTPGGLDRALVYIVISDGGVADVPQASCVAEHLRGKANPSRAEIEAAFAACRKR